MSTAFKPNLDKPRRYFATCSKSVEEGLAQELAELGAESIKAQVAGVSFAASLSTLYDILLGTRLAQRILYPLRTFKVQTPDHLYEGAKHIQWTDHFLSVDKTFAIHYVTSQLGQAGIRHSHFGALKVKDAIVDQFTERTGVRPSANPANPDIRILVHYRNEEATVSLDLSGEPLHVRGYRTEAGEAPLRETIAASCLRTAQWGKRFEESLKSVEHTSESSEPSLAKPAPSVAAFCDPMCGSGTLVIEAALMAYDIAPGLLRLQHRIPYGVMAWKLHDESRWQQAVERAQSRQKTRSELIARLCRGNHRLRVVGTDRDRRVITRAIANAERAGLTGKVHFEVRELTETTLPEALSASGVVVTNPPYGERLGEEENLISTYALLGDFFKKKLAGWHCFILTGSAELAKKIGLKSAQRHIVFNGPIECRLIEFSIRAGKF